MDKNVMDKNLELEIIETKSDFLNPLQSVGIVENRLLQYNNGFIKNHTHISIFLKNKTSREIKGGLIAIIRSGVMYIETLIIDKEFRSHKFGTNMIQEAEKTAINNKCNCIYLDTFTFQALPFYQKLGYEVFAELDEYDNGIKLYWLKKSLNK